MADEIQISDSVKKSWPIIAKYGPTVLLLFLAIFLSVYFRLGPVDLAATHVYAEQSVNNAIIQSATQEIDAKYPLLPDANKQQLIDKQVAEFKAANKDQITQAISERATYFKTQFQDENNQTYLIGIDPDYYFRFIRNILERGHAGEYERDGKTYTKFILAPTETDVTNHEREFHVVATVWIYNLMHFFNQNLLPISLFFLMPAIFAGLAAIPAFFIGKEISGNIGGFVTAVIIGLHASILTRTPAGFADTDIYNIFFPLLITYFVIKGFKAEKFWQEILYMVATGASIALYSTAWDGWWNMFYYAFGAYCVAIGIDILLFWNEHRKNGTYFFKHIPALIKRLRPRLILLGSYIVAISIFITLIGDHVSDIIVSLFGFVSFISIKDAAHTNLWPNVYTTVAELQPADSLTNIINQLGAGFASNGYIMVILAAVGIFFIIKSKEKLDYRAGLAALIILWIAATSYASIKGVRFIMLMVPPLAIAIGAFVGFAVNWIEEAAKKHFEMKGSLLKIISAIALIAILLGPMIAQAAQINKASAPSLNDQWMDTLHEIKDNSNETAIISSWWDFGHTFITYAQRGATADGGSQNTPQAHWLGKMLLASSERESAGILRMLDCGGNTAFEKIYGYTNNTVQSIDHINKLTTVGETEATLYLDNAGFTDVQIADILESTHCTPPEAFVITSEDMVSKAPVWAHFGAWNFSKADMWIAVSEGDPVKAADVVKAYDPENPTKTLAQLKRFTQQQADSWISPFPRYFSDLAPCTTTNESIQCQNGVVVDTSETVSVSTQQGLIKPQKVVLFANNKTIVRSQEGGAADVAVVLLQDGTEHKAIITSPEIATSTFNKLFILNSGGKYFTLFKDVTDITGQRIMTWTVNWDTVLAED